MEICVGCAIGHKRHESRKESVGKRTQEGIDRISRKREEYQLKQIIFEKVIMKSNAVSAN